MVGGGWRLDITINEADMALIGNRFFLLQMDVSATETRIGRQFNFVSKF